MILQVAKRIANICFDRKGGRRSEYELLASGICARIFGLYHSDVFLALCGLSKKIIRKKSDVPVCFLFYGICFID